MELKLNSAFGTIDAECGDKYYKIRKRSYDWF